MGQIVQVVGSLLVLAGFAAAQAGVLLLEGVWAVVSAIGLIGVLRGKPSSAAVVP